MGVMRMETGGSIVAELIIRELGLPLNGARLEIAAPIAVFPGHNHALLRCACSPVSMWQPPCLNGQGGARSRGSHGQSRCRARRPADCAAHLARFARATPLRPSAIADGVPKAPIVAIQNAAALRTTGWVRRTWIVRPISQCGRRSVDLDVIIGMRLATSI